LLLNTKKYSLHINTESDSCVNQLADAPNQQVIFENNSFKKLTDFLKTKPDHKVLLIVDFNTGEYCLPLIADILKSNFIGKPILFEAGEDSKSLTNAAIIWSKLLSYNADRNTIIVNLGGGMICDLGAFAASTFKRGIPFINIPTSLMAMTDAAIGGKSAINFEHYKNQIGTFYFPELVYINTLFLKTLPDSEILSGFAEVIKYSLIADLNLWEKISKFTNIDDIRNEFSEIIKCCVKLKLAITGNDPLEKSIRKVLNAGHTIGHAIESMYIENNKFVSHGYAVAHGLIAECFLSAIENNLAYETYYEIKNYILKLYPETKFNQSDINQLLQFMLADKKNKDSQIGFTFIKNIGSAKINCYLTQERLLNHLNKYFYEKN